MINLVKITLTKWDRDSIILYVWLSIIRLWVTLCSVVVGVSQGRQSRNIDQKSLVYWKSPIPTINTLFCHSAFDVHYTHPIATLSFFPPWPWVSLTPPPPKASNIFIFYATPACTKHNVLNINSKFFNSIKGSLNFTLLLCYDNYHIT
jgi:hypothetical protein